MLCDTKNAAQIETDLALLVYLYITYINVFTNTRSKQIWYWETHTRLCHAMLYFALWETVVKEKKKENTTKERKIGIQNSLARRLKRFSEFLPLTCFAIIEEVCCESMKNRMQIWILHVEKAPAVNVSAPCHTFMWLTWRQPPNYAQSTTQSTNYTQSTPNLLTNFQFVRRLGVDCVLTTLTTAQTTWNTPTTLTTALTTWNNPTTLTTWNSPTTLTTALTTWNTPTFLTTALTTWNIPTTQTTALTSWNTSTTLTTALTTWSTPTTLTTALTTWNSPTTLTTWNAPTTQTTPTTPWFTLSRTPRPPC